MRLFFIIISHFIIYTGILAQEVSDSAIRVVNPEEFYIQMHLHDYHLLIDVRSRMEYRISRIPGAILAENSTILYSLTDTLDYDTPLFLYCTTDTRSFSASKLLAQKGFKIIFVLEPGILGWKSAGNEIDKKWNKRNK
jgi:rhodanese-related sulfurtransferase